MLAPSQQDVEQDLADTANVLRHIGGFAETCLSTSIAQQDPPLDWVPEVQGKLAQCRQTAQNWLNARINIIPPISSMFVDYAALITGAARTFSPAATTNDWVNLLTELLNAARKHSREARAVRDLIGKHHGDFAAAHQALRAVVEKARQAQAAENADMQSIAGKLGQLFQKLEALGVDATAQSMVAGKVVTKTMVQISYKVVTTDLATAASVEVPYFTVVTSLYDTGSSIYTAVKDDADIRDLLKQVSQLMVRLDGDARALVMINTLLASLDRMNEAYTQANETVPRLNSYWDEEADKLGIVIEELGNNVAPASISELARFSAAVTVWQHFANVARGMAIPESVESRVVPLDIKIPVAA